MVQQNVFVYNKRLLLRELITIILQLLEMNTQTLRRTGIMVKSLHLWSVG